MHYIQYKLGRNLETVDSFESYKEAKKALKEYQLSDGSLGVYYISQRACKAWYESQ